ncbi:MAG: DUF3794 domain-containing protein, partial [Oscillospiraceae bacterium]|nr:DUF3794 domain-containing protein [Oscillospiraceae bacterium]
MELKILKEAVCINKTIYEGMVEQAVDSDVTLPDYCPDILRILKCTMTPRITASQTAGDRITVDGSTLLRAIYVTENGKVHCYEQSIPFSKFVDEKGLDTNPCVYVRAKTEYINCRAVSPRRLDIHGAVSLSIKVVAKHTQDIMSNAQGAGIQTLQKNIELSSVIGNSGRAFPLTDVVEIGAGQPPMSQIIRTNAFAAVNEIKIISNKAMIKGD